MKRLYSLALIFCLAVSMLSACGKDSHEGELSAYYLNLDGSSMSPGYFTPENEDGKELAEQYLEALSKDPEDSDLRRTIPGYVKVLGYTIDDYMLILNLSREYYDLTTEEEVLIRAAIVRTLCQVEGISYVTFNVEGQPFVNKRGETVGLMNEDSFVENPDSAINTTLETTLTLYFSSRDGMYLLPEKRHVHYSSNETLAKVIVEKLIEGPQSSDMLGTIPATAKIITVSESDGVCYVNLDANYFDQNEEISEAVVLYSLVNSLTELAGVQRVQLAINGDTSGKSRYNYSLSAMYTRDESYFTAPKESGESATE